MKIKVLVNGSAGKMGQAVVKAVSDDSDFLLVGQCDHEHDLAEEIKKSKADVVVDFTNAEVAFKNAKIIIDAKVRPVIGTTGFLPEDIKKLQDRCAELKLGCIIAPNFSLGAVLMMRHAAEIAKYFPHVEIIEMHHDGKLDSPSGTAVRSAEMMAMNREGINPPKITKEIVPGARGATYKDISIHSIRLPGLVAHQQIMFGGKGETLTIRHDSIDRSCFMPGVVLACKEVMKLNHLVFGLENIL